MPFVHIEPAATLRLFATGENDLIRAGHFLLKWFSAFRVRAILEIGHTQDSKSPVASFLHPKGLKYVIPQKRTAVN